MPKYRIEFSACFTVEAENEDKAIEEFDDQLNFDSAKITEVTE